MKNMKKIMVVLLICVLAISCFAACENDSKDDHKATATPSGTPVATQTTTPEATAEATAAPTETAGAVKTGFSGTFIPQTVTLEDGTEVEYEKFMEDSLKEEGIEPGSEEYEMAKAMAEVKYIFKEDGTMTLKMLGIDVPATYTFENSKGKIVLEGEEVAQFTYDSETKTLTETDETGSKTIFKIEK